MARCLTGADTYRVFSVILMSLIAVGAPRSTPLAFSLGSSVVVMVLFG